MPDQIQIQKNTDNIAALTAAVSRLSESVSQLTQNAAASSERIDQLTQNAAARSERIDQQIDQLTQNAAARSERIDQLTQNAAARSERIDQQIDQLTQNAAASSERINQLTNTIDVLVGRFIRPATQQANANREAIAALIERGQLYQDWLDEDRRDINELRQETASQIQALIDQANADRQASVQRFEAMQAEIRQNQRLLLSGQEKNETLLAEVLSLSQRLDTVEDAA